MLPSLYLAVVTGYPAPVEQVRQDIRTRNYLPQITKVKEEQDSRHDVHLEHVLFAFLVPVTDHQLITTFSE